MTVKSIFQISFTLALIAVFTLFAAELIERTTTFSDGKVRERWTEITDSTGRKVKHGLYQSWDAMGTLRKQGDFVLGKLHGKVIEWGSEGRKRLEAEYKNNRQNGLWLEFDDNGIIINEFNYRDGQRHGKAIIRHPDGNIKGQGVYRNGLKDSLWLWWHENGQISDSGYYAEGVRIGQWTDL